MLTGVGGVTLGIDNGTGVVFLIVREFRCEMFGDIGGDEHSEFIGVMVAAEDGCQYCGKGVLLMEKVCDEGSSVRVDSRDEELLKSLDADPNPQPLPSKPLFGASCMSAFSMHEISSPNSTQSSVISNTVLDTARPPTIPSMASYASHSRTHETPTPKRQSTPLPRRSMT